MSGAMMIVFVSCGVIALTALIFLLVTGRKRSWQKQQQEQAVSPRLRRRRPAPPQIVMVEQAPAGPVEPPATEPVVITVPATATTAPREAPVAASERRPFRFFLLTVIVPLFFGLALAWLGGLDLREVIQQHYQKVLLVGLLTSFWVYLEWRRPGVSHLFLSNIWRPPLFKFLILSGLGICGLVAGRLWYGIEYLSFIEQDQTPISKAILAVAALGWLEGLYQAAMLAIRIREFNRLDRLARQVTAPQVGATVNGGRLATIIDQARSSLTMVGDYIVRVNATGGKYRPSQQMLVENLEDRLVQGAQVSQGMIVIIPVLGLIGTIVGMKMGMVGMRQVTGDVAQFSTSANTFLSGIDTALNTTLIGSALGGVYFYLQYRILLGGAMLLKCSISDFVEVAVVSHEVPPLAKEEGA